MQNIRLKAQDGLRGFCRCLDDILMTGQGRFSELSVVMTLSLFGVYAWANTSRVLKVFGCQFWQLFFCLKFSEIPSAASTGCACLQFWVVVG
ncbi:hypothetical protein JFT81_07300 [Pseudomonas sp. TH43]|nr:hypothetical protein [Pseudomonas sp. TH43]